MAGQCCLRGNRPAGDEIGGPWCGVARAGRCHWRARVRRHLPGLALSWGRRRSRGRRQMAGIGSCGAAGVIHTRRQQCTALWRPSSGGRRILCTCDPPASSLPRTATSAGPPGSSHSFILKIAGLRRLNPASPGYLSIPCGPISVAFAVARGLLQNRAKKGAAVSKQLRGVLSVFLAPQGIIMPSKGTRRDW